jgi:hypothetical protein
MCLSCTLTGKSEIAIRSSLAERVTCQMPAPLDNPMHPRAQNGL